MATKKTTTRRRPSRKPDTKRHPATAGITALALAGATWVFLYWDIPLRKIALISSLSVEVLAGDRIVEFSYTHRHKP